MKAPPPVIIRCQAAANVGFGHLVRCRVLAARLRAAGGQCIMVGPPIAVQEPADRDRFTDWIERPHWDGAAAEAGFHQALAERFQARHFVLDDYRSNFDHQLLLHEQGLRCLQQYDASKAKGFAADLVINSSPAEQREFYEAGLHRPEIVMLLGPRYAILRDSFLATAPRPPNRGVRRVYICFGGGDDHGALKVMLPPIDATAEPDVTLVLVIGRHSPNISWAREFVDACAPGRAELHIDPANLPELMSSCDLAVLAGGTTAFEAAFLRLPIILVSIAHNQARQIDGWASHGAAIALGNLTTLTSDAVADALGVLLGNKRQLEQLAGQARELVDGLGARRVLDRLLEWDLK